MTTEIIKPLNQDVLTVQLNESSKELKTSALTVSRGIHTVNNQDTLNASTVALRTVNKLLKEVEESRVNVKAPVLELGRKIDTLAKEFCTDLETESKRLNGLITTFQTEQVKQAREAERIRLAELERIEAEKRRVIEEFAALERKRVQEAQAAADKAERERQAELARIESARLQAEMEANHAAQKAKEREEKARQAIAEAKAPSTVARIIESTQKAVDEKELAEQNIRALDALKEKLAEPAPAPQLSAESIRAKTEADAELSKLKKESEIASKVVSFAPIRAAGQVNKMVWKFEVLSMHGLYMERPDLVTMEPKNAAIQEAIKTGLRHMPGALRIWEEVATSVR